MTGDPGFAEFYEREFAAVFRTAYLLCRDPGLAEDATQEAFARALERWERLRDTEWAGGWVTSTSMNAVRRGHRWRRRRTDPPAAGASDPDAHVDLARAVQRLPRRERQAVALYYFGDRPVTEVARVMGCAEGTVKAHLSQARRKLAEMMGGERYG